MAKALIEPADYQSCRPAVEKAFTLFAPPIGGRDVLVKPNVLRAGRPEEAITTHPAVLRAVVECLRDLGAARITVGDNPGIMGYGANEACFERAGLIEASLGCYRNIGLDAVEVPFPSMGEAMPQVSVSRAVMEADVVVSVPKFKTHGLTVITGALKNSYGILPGAQKAKLHKLAGSQERFQEVVLDVFRLRPPDMFVMDAVLGMQGNGPAGPDLRWVGRILASDNAVALDATVCRMMGFDPARLRLLRRAAELGLGDFSAVEIVGELQVLKDFRLPPLDGGAVIRSEGFRQLVESRTTMLPKADPTRCTACGTCVAQCPAHALSIVDGAAQADPDLCIRCFCCQEMCPEKAMTLVAVA